LKTVLQMAPINSGLLTSALPAMQAPQPSQGPAPVPAAAAATTAAPTGTAASSVSSCTSSAGVHVKGGSQKKKKGTDQGSGDDSGWQQVLARKPGKGRAGVGIQETSTAPATSPLRQTMQPASVCTPAEGDQGTAALQQHGRERQKVHSTFAGMERMQAAVVRGGQTGSAGLGSGSSESAGGNQGGEGGQGMQQGREPGQMRGKPRAGKQRSGKHIGSPGTPSEGPTGEEGDSESQTPDADVDWAAAGKWRYCIIA
jgi:hypothetical protein